VARGRDFARTHSVELVLAYVVPTETEPLMLRNEYLWIDARAEDVERYAKHHPVPGEPSIRGEAELVAHDHECGRAAGAICYDYDFPTMALAHAELGADLVVVPASDWRGIDPFHTTMARVRAIEGGFSVLRSTRWGASAGYDAFGRTRAWMPANDEERVMVATLPTERVATVYASVGDAPMVVLVLALLGGVVFLRRRGGPRRDGRRERG